jgi:hydroxymethylbilane synthase
MARLVLGTRGSPLALRQAEMVERALRAAAPGLDIEVRVIKTEGDRRQDVSLEEAGGQGLFVKDIEKALLAGEVDAAVHSLKDMPATTPDGLTIGAVLSRGDPRDVLVSRSGADLVGLPYGARVGTDSRRRAIQALALRPDLRLEGIRGNVDTRIRKTESGEYEAVILAAAGLDRLGLLGRAAQVFSVDEMVPAVGQAVLAVECRADDDRTMDLLASVEDAGTRAAVTAERAFLRRLGAGCRLPVGAFAEVKEGRLRLRAVLGSGAGDVFRDVSAGPVAAAEAVGLQLAERMLAAAGVTEVR